MALTFSIPNSYTNDVIIYILKVSWSKYQYRHGPKEYQENSTHTRSIKRECLTSFSIKRLYTRLDVVEITIYHKAHIQTDGSFAHGEHDLESISRISLLCSSHVTSIGGPHMGPTKLRLHDLTNI
jgi:hypothetical protein